MLHLGFPLDMRSFREPQLSRHVQEDGVSRQVKRLGDIAIACLLLGVTSPLMLIVALAIKLESAGPVLERETCVRRGGRRFQMFKFRTTVHGPRHATPAWAQKRTPVGQFLWHTRVEALPRLINVLHGEMSMLDRDGSPSSFLD
jgi:putative colanic acid biosynthesis UDP-glucose lipid carrier transferase